MSWTRADHEGPYGVESILAELQDARVPAPKGVAVLDLRMWQRNVLESEAGVEFPSRVEFADRWGWTEKRVRVLLGKEDDWSDPRLLDRWKSKRAGEGPAKGRQRAQPTTGEPKESADTGRRRAGEGPDEGHARGDLVLRDGTSQQTSAEPTGVSPAAEPDPPQAGIEDAETVIDLDHHRDKHREAFDEAARCWGREVNPAYKRRPSDGPERGSKDGQALYRAVVKDRAKVLRVFRFIAHSKHERSEFYRTKRCSLETALRKLDVLDEFANDAPFVEARAGPTYASSPLPPLTAPPPAPKHAQDTA